MKQFYSLCMIMLLASVLAIDVMGQKTTLTVTGKVTDLEGDPLSGVSVVVQGTTRGTITNIDGAYSINVPSKQSVLVFSMISMKTVDHRVGNSTQINIIMEEDVIGLGDVEVVAIGYGSMRRSDLTGSISSISKDALSERAITSLEDAMRGKAAGMQIVQNDGAPGSDYTIRIRGASSVNASSAPIFVIDGVICEDASSLNPGDVASIEILKDASSTAIYGSRGANGVIMITTRQGTNDGKTRVELYANLGMQQAVRQFDMLNSSEYALMRYKTGWKYYPYGTDPSTMSDGIVYRDNPNGDGNYWVLPESSTYADWESFGAPGSTNTQWQDLMFRDALYQEYRINVSGGNKNTRYSVSGGYLNQEGVVVNSGFERFTGRINLVQKLSTNVTMTANISGSRTKNSGLATGSSDGLMVKLLRQSPLNSATSSGITEGTGSEEGQVVSNPYIQVRDITNNRYKDNLTARMQLEWKILTELSLNIAGTYEDNHQKTDVFYPANTEQGFKANGRAIVTNAGIKKLSGEAFLTYTNSWKGGHRLKVLAGSTLETYNNNTVRTETQNFPSLNLGVNGLGMGVTPQIPTSSIVEWNMVSFLARAEYNYKERYLLTASYRADGSSRFGAGNKWAGFPSVGLAWRINEESFVKDLGVFYNLKLRFGYGRSGNTAIPSYRSLSTIASSFYPMYGSDLSYGASIDRPANPSLRWETTDMVNLGLDMSFFKNSLDVSMDFYVKKTSDMLLNMPIPSFGAFPNSPFFNAGDLKNTGFEIVVNYRNQIGKDFNYNVGLNMSTYKTEVTKLTSEYLSGNTSRTYVGGPIGRFWGYKQIGIFQNQEEIDNYVDKNGTKIQPNAQPGDFKFAKLGESGELNDDDDRTFIGDPNPDLIYGFNLGFSYKNFDVSMAFQGTIGNDIWNVAKGSLASAGRQNALADAYTKAWTKDGDLDAVYPRITNSDSNNNMRGSSFYVENGSYLRLQNMQIGYTLPSHICQKSKLFSSCRFYVSGQNIFTLTGYSGLDPELGINNPLDMGVDTTRYPSSRTFTFGVNLQF